MSSVKLETRNEGRGLREWDYVPLSEPRVVTQQIQNRHKCDESLYALSHETTNPIVSNGVFPFSEPVLVTYMDLDHLIETAQLTKPERKIVRWAMYGYSLQDIGDHYGCGETKVRLLLKSAANKICEENNKQWSEAFSKNRCNNIEGRD